jgi:hypothetical protein
VQELSNFFERRVSAHRAAVAFDHYFRAGV